MRWRLGRSTPKQKAGTCTPVDVVIEAPTNRASSMTTASPVAGTDWHRSGGSSEVQETSTVEVDGDHFYYATASCLSLRGRSANGARTTSRTTDGLTSSLVSFVEGLGSQPRRQSSPVEGAHFSPSPTGLATPDDGSGTDKRAVGGADNALLSTVGASVDGSVDRSSNTTVTTPVRTATSTIPTTGRAKMAQEDLLTAEVYDYLLRRGGVDHNIAAAAARMCLALMLSREPTLEAIQEIEAADLVSSARENLGLSSGASACLLAHLVDNWTTAARSIAAGIDLDDSRLRYPLGGDGHAHNGVVKGVEDPFPHCVLHRPGTQTGDRVFLSGTKTLAASGAEAAEAATTLYEACRTWRDIIEATKRRTSDGHRDGAVRTRATTSRVSSRGVDKRDSFSPAETSWFCSLESPRGQSRPHLGSSNEHSTTATVPTAIVDGTSDSREGGQQDRISHHLRQAIRVVTSGARNCYGQLVVLGYKEFSVRDSTWHRVGVKNARFVLARREAPNGVHIGGRSGGGGGGKGRTDSNRIRIVHENNVVCSPLCCQADSHTPDPVCSTPTYDSPDAPAENAAAAEDTVKHETRNGAGYGHPSEFKTPEARPPNGASDSCEGRNPTHRRNRCGSGTGNTGSSYTTGGHGGRGGHDVGENRDGGAGRCFPSAQRGSGCDAAEAVVVRETPYRVQLLISVQQREAAEGAGVGRMPKTQSEAAAADRGEDAVNISCSANDGCDMYQLGRMEGGENDFAVRGPLHQSKPGGKLCGPVSRYALRLLVDRAPPHRCRIFAGGFNSRKCLMLPKSSPKWLEEHGEWDAVTPFGVRILKPGVGEWREVTVAGAVRQPRVGHLNPVGDLMPDENNELISGTVIDVGGVQILYESVETMSRLGGVQPSRVVELLNGRRPQCPIQLQTLRFKPWQPPPANRPCATGGGGGGRAAANSTAATPGGSGFGGGNVGDGSGSVAAPAMDAEDEGENTEVEEDDDEDEAKSLVPHVFPACGHVQGYAKQLAWGPCPMCRTPGPLVEILFGWCPAIDREVPTVVFNPCGHAASLEVAERWSRLAMPNNAPPDAVYRPICPYCAKPLQCKNGERPYSKMIFAR